MEVITQAVTGKLAELAALGQTGVRLENPDARTSYPCCVVHPPQAKPLYGAAMWELSISVELWAARPYEALRLLDEVQSKLQALNLVLSSNTPLVRDEVSGLWRLGGQFEVRWNAITNYFQKSR
jgi:hypothetical protein